MNATSDILSEIGQFLRDLFQDFASGLIFFGGPADVVVAVIDILATTLVVYYVLKILRDSRAWQLLKGLLLILGFAILCSLAGLNTVGFLLNNTLSVFAIAFVVIFQPELRRALETVGRNSFSVISSAITPEDRNKAAGYSHNIIEAIVRACESLSASQTGALIILERQTKLGELIEQENVVSLDAAVSATMLLQVFYKGSPLHDGAVLIRDGRLAAARVHVPLSDNYHLRRDYGTRHRAAIGVSEMGDAIAVVVSEERGTISLTKDGRLYVMDNGDALRALLHKLLSVTRTPVSLGSLFRGGMWQNRPDESADATAGSDPDVTSAPADDTKHAGKTRRRAARRGKHRLLLFFASLAIAIVLWLYVQVTINPIESRTFSVPLSYQGIESAETRGYELQIPLQTIQVTLMGRRKTVTELKAERIEAYIDFSQIDSTGIIRLAVQVDTGGLLYLETTYISPATVAVSVRQK
jgi:uncharacterized protein (TIGR00159 family)